MEIGRVSRGRAMQSGTTVSSRKDFSQNLNQERNRKSNEQLKKMVDNIKKKGNRLVITKTYLDVKIYTRMIREYLESVLEYMYQTKQDISFWQNQYFITVEIIDEKLEELTKILLFDEKNNINIASKIDEIQGLVVDIYR